MRLGWLMILVMSIGGFMPIESAESAGWITVTACDSVIIDHQGYAETSFRVHNIDPTNAIAVIAMRPRGHKTSDDTCHVLQLAAPPNWETHMNAYGGPVWLAVEFGSEILPGEVLDGFRAVFSRPTCCYDLAFFGAVVDPFAFGGVCFQCDDATSQRSLSWGRIKSQYR